ncbi:MAG: PepSY-like domain-containing protein [Candidatus Saccharimonadaceae bacterium]
MRKIFIPIGLLAILTFGSCRENKKAPESMQASMEKLFPGISKVEWDDEEDNTWEAEFKNNGIKTSVTFNADGSLKEIEEEIALADFPQAAQNYLKQNYPGEKTEDITKMTNDKNIITYEAEVKDLNLIFDPQGNFIKMKNEDKEYTELLTNNTSSIVSGKVEIDSLPQTVNEFVTNNYNGYKIESAAHDPMCNGEDAIDVSITKVGSKPFSLIFTPQGAFIQQEEDVSIEIAPSNVMKVLKTKYADYNADQQIEKLSLTDKSVQYLVDLSKNGVNKEVIFDAQGNVICEH